MNHIIRPTKSSRKTRKTKKIVSFYEYHQGPVLERIERRAVKREAPADPFGRFKHPEAARRHFLTLRDFDTEATYAQWQCLSHILNGICVMLREQKQEPVKTINSLEVSP